MDEQNIARFTQMTLNQDFIGLPVFNKNVFSILTNTTILKYHANLSFWKKKICSTRIKPLLIGN